MTNEEYGIACTEVLGLLKYIPEEEYKIIPDSVLEILEKNKKQEYMFEYDNKKELAGQVTVKATYSMIVLLYRDYFLNDEKREKLNHILELNQKEEDERLREKYNPDNLFKNAEKPIEDSKNESLLNSSTQLIVAKKGIFTRLLNKIKSFFDK